MKYRTSGRVDGGARITTRMNHRTPMTFNHDVTDCVADRRADFEELTKLLLARVARQMLDSIHPSKRTKEQTQLLKDVIRGRRNVKLLADLLALAPKSHTPQFLGESIYGEVERALPTSAGCPVDAYLDETRTQAVADVAQVGFICERTSTRRDAAIQACVRQMDRLRAFLNVLHCWPNRNAA